MYELMVTANFASAHQLKGYEGACENLHGHNWRIDIYLRSATLNNIGLAMDFKEVKEVLNRQIDKLDHKLLNEIDPFNKINPSSEHIAKYLFDILKDQFKAKEIDLHKVSIWESNYACASYFE